MYHTRSVRVGCALLPTPRHGRLSLQQERRRSLCLWTDRSYIPALCRGLATRRARIAGLSHARRNGKCCGKRSTARLSHAPLHTECSATVTGAYTTFLTSFDHARRMFVRTSSRFLASSRKSNSVKNCFSTSLSMTRCSGCARAQKSFMVLMSDRNIASTFGNITYIYRNRNMFRHTTTVTAKKTPASAAVNIAVAHRTKPEKKHTYTNTPMNIQGARGHTNTRTKKQRTNENITTTKSASQIPRENCPDNETCESGSPPTHKTRSAVGVSTKAPKSLHLRSPPSPRPAARP